VIDPLLLIVIRVGLGLMFLLAAVHKLGNLARFRAVLADYRVLPPALVPLASRLVPVMETGIGLGWLAAASAPVVPAATVAILLAYTAGIAVNLHRGRVHISCGCGFGNAAGADTLSIGLVARNGLLVAAASVALLPAQVRSLGVVDYLLAGTALGACLALFAAGNQLIRNQAALGSWRRAGTRH
jgi:hypothetical protein